MKSLNSKQNTDYFNSLAKGVAGEQAPTRIRSVYPTQLSPGSLVKFSYLNTGLDYTAVVASTARAPGGRYIARGTRNLLVTMFLLRDYELEDQLLILNAIYAKGSIKKRKLASYRPEVYNEEFIKRAFTRFLGGIFKKITFGNTSTLLKSYRSGSGNFRTFMASKMVNCKVLK